MESSNYFIKYSVFLLTMQEAVLRYAHVKQMLPLSEELGVLMVVSIGEALKSSKKSGLENSKIISVKLLTNWNIPATIRVR